MSSSFSDLAERPLTPTELLQALNLAGHKGTHRIEGQVVDVHHSEKHTYLTVEGGGNTIKVRVKDRSVPLAATVACEGTVFVNVPKSTVFSGFEVLLNADSCLVLQRAAVVDDVKRKPRVMLDAFVRENNTHPLVWVGTQTGHDDAFAEFKKRFSNARPFQFQPVNITDPAQVIEGVRKAVLAGARGIMLVRGGGDPVGMQMWNDHRLVKELLDFGVPTYVALGHHKDRFLMDQLADESFSTPTAAGSALARALGTKLSSSKNRKSVQKLDWPMLLLWAGVLALVVAAAIKVLFS